MHETCVCVRACVRVRVCVCVCVCVCVLERKTKDIADGMTKKNAHSPRWDSNPYLWDTRGLCPCVHVRVHVIMCVRTVIQFYFGSVQFSVKPKFPVSVRRKFRKRERDPHNFEQAAASVMSFLS